MKKLFLFSFLAVFLAGLGFGGISMAGDEQETPCATTTGEPTKLHVAKITADGITTNYYCTLGAAITAANNGDTITLLQDVNENVAISSDKTIILNLGGKTLRNVSEHTITNNGNLTIEGDGTVDNVTHAKAAIYNSPKGKATLNGGTFTRSQEAGSTPENSNGNSYYTIENHGIMEINEGVTVYNKGHFSSMLHNGYYDGSKKGDNISPELTINGGHFDGGIKTVKNDDFGILTINGGTYTNNTQGCVLNWNTATINGGTFNPSDTYAIELGYKAEPYDAAKLTINGGTFNGGFRYNTPSKTDHEVSITGGKFTEDVSKYTAEGYYSIYDGEEYYEVTNEIGTLTRFYMSSNFQNAEFKVILNETGDSIDLWKTKAYLEKELTAEEKAASTLYQLLKLATSTDGIEVLEAAGEKLMFVNNSTENRTDVFRSSTSGKFNGDAFLPSKSTEYPTDGLVYGEAIKPTWVTNVTPDKYNEIKDGENVIGYTLHTNDNGWFYAPKAYTITFVDEDGTTVLHTQVVALGITPVFDGTTPTKAADSSYTYTFKEWTPALAEVTADATYKATYTATKKSTSSSGGGGGGSSSSSCKNLPSNAVANNSKKPSSSTNYFYDTDTTKVCSFVCKEGYEWNKTDSKCEVKKTTTTTGDNTKVDEPKVDENNENAGTDIGGTPSNEFSKEFNDAYTWAFKNGITTMDSIEKADMNAPLTRIAMAKMLSQYAINVLGKTPDTSRVVPAFPDVDEQLNKDYNDGVTLAYQLGIMGINVDTFRPFDLVTRAEFGTALSRMLFDLSDGEEDLWYKPHLDKLMNEKIITIDTPDLQELRGYVMIMLMRSAQ